jgi:UDP-N-acetyl-2-amino-2-deoxyglucuronate dehydrogenase
VRKLRTAVIGVGKVGPTHAQALAELPESEFVAVYGRNAERTAEFAARYGVTPFNDVGKMVREASVEAVVIGTPHPAHAEGALAALEAGAHVLVEKPLASTLADSDAMIALAERQGLQIGVISQRRWTPPAQRVKEAIDAGKIGKPALGMVTMLGWRDEKYFRSDPWRGKWELEGGGVLVNQSPHQVDLLLWYMGPVAEVFGYWENLNHPYIEVEDTAIAVIRFENGALGNIVVSNSQKPGLYGKVHVHGTNGATVGVQTDGGAMFIAGMSAVLEPPVNDLWTVPGEESRLPEWQEADRASFNEHDAAHYYHRLQIQEFLQALLAGRAPAVTAADGRAVVELFTGIYRSQRDHSPVTFPLFPETGRTDMDGRRRNA